MARGVLASLIVVCAVAATASTQSLHNFGVGTLREMPNPRTCTASADVMIMCMKLARPYQTVAHTLVFGGPRAGRVFTGGYLWVSDKFPSGTWNVSCDARLGGKLAWDGGPLGGGDLYSAGGVRLTPIIHTLPTNLVRDGTRYTTLVTCGWRIPASATGALLSLVRPRADVPCDPDCSAWGFHIETADGQNVLAECSETTWHVRGHDATIGRLATGWDC
jgi:hypothetical protein